MESDQMFGVAELLPYCPVIVCLLVSPRRLQAPLQRRKQPTHPSIPRMWHRAWHTMGSQHMPIELC